MLNSERMDLSVKAEFFFITNLRRLSSLFLSLGQYKDEGLAHSFGTSVLMGFVALVYNPSIWEAEAEGLPSIQGQPRLYDEYQVSQGYVARHCLKKRVDQNKNI